MRHIFEFEMSAGESREDGSVVLGKIPVAGTVIRAKPIWKDGRAFYLIEIEDDPNAPGQALPPNGGSA